MDRVLPSAPISVSPTGSSCLTTEKAQLRWYPLLKITGETPPEEQRQELYHTIDWDVKKMTDDVPRDWSSCWAILVRELEASR